MEYIKRFYRGYKARDFIFLVYTYGKVGSSSIYNTIRERIYKANVFHVHFLGNCWLEEKLPDTNKSANINVADEVLTFIKQNSEKKIVIISLVREPISREISNLFQNSDDFFGNKSLEKVSALEAISALKQTIKEKATYVDKWFDEDFILFTKWDIFKEPFDKQLGYSMYQLSNNVSVLFLKMEEINSVFTEAFYQMTGIKLKEISNANEGKNKASKALYNEVRKGFKLSGTEIDEIYSARYVRHFYSAEEISSFKKKHQI